MDYANRAAFQVLLTAVPIEPDLSEILEFDAPAQLRSTTCFTELVDLVLANRALWKKFLNAPELDTHVGTRELARAVIDLMLLRGLCLAQLKHNWHDPREIARELAEFLGTDAVSRKVILPVAHVELSEDQIDLGDFGTFHKPQQRESKALSRDVLEKFLGPPYCLLEFEVHTGHFLNATDYPLADEISSRLGVLRLAFHPLVSASHFHVSHTSPWEQRLRDTDFREHFYTNPRHDLTVATLTPQIAKSLRDFRTMFDHMPWNRSTPWRLAIDRLESAIFKLECNSPDAILDVVIGLESVFLEDESRQESTHKVAARAARYLEDSLDARRDLFRRLKQMYRTRTRWS